MRRRAFIAGIGAVASWPRAAKAQQSAMPVIGFLGATSPEGYATFVNGFLLGLKDQGFADTENVAIAYHWAQSSRRGPRAKSIRPLRRWLGARRARCWSALIRDPRDF
jgi:putative tryptophan/tyrosine transport system substrate-binding protein